ncbi:MAG: class I SAM-dependent methyltransferase [Patescibacteria group bacterium]
MDKKTTKNLLELSKNSYDKIAADFDVTRKKEIWPEIRNFTEQVLDEDKILDAGCGNGRLLETLKTKEINYLGIDNSAELIALAQKNYPDYKFLEAELTELSFTDLEKFGKEKFNYIFCLAVLQHIPSQSLRVRLLENLRAFLAPNGKIIISNWNLWASRHRNLILKQAWKKIIGRSEIDFGDIIFPWKNKEGQEISSRYYHAFTKKELISISKQAGFKNIKIKKDKYNYWLTLN